MCVLHLRRWEAGDLLLSGCWVPILGGQGFGKVEQMNWGVSLLDLCLSTHSLLSAQRSQLRIELCGWCFQNAGPRARGPQI